VVCAVPGAAATASLTMLLARIYLERARHLSHLRTRAQRHTWVRAKLRYPAPRVRIGALAAPNMDHYRFRRAA
jgi:hypothetical protein